jgi:TPR repeat protein
MRNPTAAYVPDEQKKSAIEISQEQILKKDPSLDREFELPPVERPRIRPTPLAHSPTKITDLTQGRFHDGDLLATKNLGLKHYANKEYKEARKWFEIAAIKKEPEAMRYLGILYFMGQGVELDYKQATHWFTNAVRAGDLESTRYLRIVKQFKN